MRPSKNKLKKRLPSSPANSPGSLGEGPSSTGPSHGPRSDTGDAGFPTTTTATSSSVASTSMMTRGWSVRSNGGHSGTGSVTPNAGRRRRRSSVEFEWVVPPTPSQAAPSTAILDDLFNDGRSADPLTRSRSRSLGPPATSSRNRQSAMFSFRSRPKASHRTPHAEPSYVLPAVKDTSPDLPGLAPYLIADLGEENDNALTRTTSAPGKAKIEQRSARSGFHKPSSFYGRPLTPNDSNGHGSTQGRQDFLRPAATPAAGEKHVSKSSAASRPSLGSPHHHPIRKAARSPPCLNIMVVGAARTGKTSFLQTLLATAELTGAASTKAEAQARIRNFGMQKGASEGTKEVDSVSVGVRGGDRETIALTVVDTPGLEAGSEGLRAEIAVTQLLRLVESKFDDSLLAESQVSRTPQRAGDAHIHLIIYFLDPGSVSVGPFLRPELSSDAAAKVGSAGLAKVDVRLIARLRKRANVLPVCKATVKAIVRRELASAGFGFGVFQSKPASSTDSDDEEEDDNKTQTDGNNIDKGEDFDTYDGESAVLPSEPSEVSQRGPDLVVDAPEDEDVEATHDIPGSLSSTQKPPRPPRSPSRSRSAVQSRKPVRPSDSTGFIEESSDDVNSYVSSSSSSEDGAAAALEPLLPFCLISPEVDPARHKRHSEGQRFLRKFRWGEVDVLDPKHCDFEPLKAAILGSHMEKLKSSTRQLYEAYRTERLESRRRVPSRTR